jgi:hypothetical protein
VYLLRNIEIFLIYLQAFGCGILVGSILYQSVAFWYMPVRCPARLARRGVRNGPYWTPR